MTQVTVAPEVSAGLPVIDDTRLPLSRQPNLWERIAGKVREKHYSLATERTYVMWAKKFVLWSGKRHPKDMGAAEVTAYLNHLAVDREVSASTQNQALSALLFLYKEVLGTELPWLDDLTRAKRSKHIPAHREIIAAPEGSFVDHVNGNGLDNRRSNLRLATRRQNNWNRAAQRDATSGFHGVSLHKASGLWRARLRVGDAAERTTYHATAEAAARARDEMAIAARGEFACLNFPQADRELAAMEAVRGTLASLVAGQAAKDTPELF